jgi:hypothetical protein
MTYQYRNARHNQYGSIDMEINHPAYGWIPFTAAEDDELQHGRDLYAAALPTAGPALTPVINSFQVNNERERRIVAGKTIDVPGYGQIPLQGRDQDMINLQALAFAASMRIAAGDTTTLTPFRDASNVGHMLTPPQVLAMWSLGSTWISAVYQASWALKALDPIPVDYTNNSHWPA